MRSFSSLPALPSVADLVKLYGLSARQQLSQNFLLDLNVCRRVVRAASSVSPVAGSTVLEVGAGPGSLTRALLEGGARHVIALEKDERFVPALRTLQQAVGSERLTVLLGDALDCDEALIFTAANAVPCSWDTAQASAHVMGNLPFAISTELLLKWIRQIPTRSGPFRFGRVPLTLLFQKEVAYRLFAKSGTSNYGRLSVMSQHCATVHKKFDIRGSAFVPAPDVDAGVVTLVPLLEPQIDVNQASLEHVLRKVFGQRRKILKNSCSSLEYGDEILAESGLDEKLRPDQTTVKQWGMLTKAYDKVMAKHAAEAPGGAAPHEVKKSSLSSSPDEIKKRT